jgi:hypothetical protein
MLDWIAHKLLAIINFVPALFRSPRFRPVHAHPRNVHIAARRAHRLRNCSGAAILLRNCTLCREVNLIAQKRRTAWCAGTIVEEQKQEPY